MVESVITQSNEKVKTDPLHMTSTTTPTENILETPEIINTGTSTLRSEELSLQNLMYNEKEKIPSNIHTEEPLGREKLCTRVMNETTLRIFCLKKSNTEPFTQDFSTPIVSPIVQDTAKETKDLEEAKVLKEKTDVQG